MSLRAKTKVPSVATVSSSEGLAFETALLVVREIVRLVWTFLEVEKRPGAERRNRLKHMAGSLDQDGDHPAVIGNHLRQLKVQLQRTPRSHLEERDAGVDGNLDDDVFDHRAIEHLFAGSRKCRSDNKNSSDCILCCRHRHFLPPAPASIRPVRRQGDAYATATGRRHGDRRQAVAQGSITGLRFLTLPVATLTPTGPRIGSEPEGGKFPPKEADGAEVLEGNAAEIDHDRWS